MTSSPRSSLEHHLKLRNQIVPVAQQADAVVLTIEIVVLERQSKRVRVSVTPGWTSQEPCQS